MSNLQLIEDYLKELEQENMSVADSTHADPLSAQEGAKQVYENDPRLKAYRNRQAQGQQLKKDPNYYKNLADSIPASGDAFGIKPIFRQEETDIPSVSNKVLSDTAATIAQIPDAAAGAFKQGAGGVLQALGTPGEQQNYAGTMRGIEMFSDALKSQFGKPAVDYGEDLYQTGSQQYQQAYEQAPYKMPLEIGANVANMIPPVVGGIVTRNPAVALSPIFGQVYGSKFAQSRSEGRSPEEAHMDGTVFGGAEAVSELIPLGFITKIGGNFLWNAAKSGMAEAIQEPVNQIIQNLYDVGVLGKDMTLDEALGGIKHASQVGGASGVILSALAALFTRSRGTVSPVASEGMPNLPALPQGPAPEFDPSAIQEPYRTTPSVDVVDDSIDMRRRKFLGDMRDIATVAATNPTDLLPGLGEIAAPEAVETAAPVVAPKVTVDYLNPPLPTDYVFDINGKTVYAMTPDHIDIEQGDTFVQFSDDMGGSDLPGGVPNTVDIGPYLDQVESVSQRDVDKAVARAIQDTLINEGDEFFLGDVRRYYDEAGNNADPATFGQIEQMEGMNDPEGIFDEIMLNQFPSAYLGPGERFPSPDSTPRQIKKLGGYSRIESKPTSEPRLRKDPGSNSVSPFESRVEKEALLIQERERAQQLSKDREVTDAIPRLPVLNRKLSEAIDRLKSLEAGNPPPGFEDDYTQEEIEEDIRLEKSNIEALEEELRIKQEEPIDAEFEEAGVPPSLDAISTTETTRKDPDGKILRDAIRFLEERGLTIPETRDKIYHKAYNRKNNEQLSEPKRNLKKMREYLSSVANTAKQEPRREEAKKLRKELTNDKSLMTDSDFLSRVSNLRVTNSKNSKGFDALPDQTEEGPRTASQIRREREQKATTPDSLTPAGQMALRAFGADKNRGQPRRYRLPDGTLSKKKETHHFQRVFDYKKRKYKHHSDHIQRLKDGGLHDENNLQLLTANDHLKKSSLELKGKTEEAKDKFKFKQENLPRSQRDLLAENQEDLKAWLKRLDAQDASFAEEVRESMEPALRNEEAEFFEKTKKIKGRTYIFKGADHLPGVDLNRVINKTNVKGKGDEKIEVVFVYVPSTEKNAYDSLADVFVPGLGSVFGRAQKKQGSSGYKIAINLAQFNAHGVANIIEQEAANEGITAEELLKRIGDEFLQEYAIRSILQHEVTHINHYIWQEKLLKKLGISERPGDKSFLRFSLDSYQTFRKDLVEFFDKQENGYARIGLVNNSWDHKNQKPTFIENNEQALFFLDEIMRRGAEPTASHQQKIQTTRAAFSMLSELLAYKSQERTAEGFIKKFIRKIKMLLAKVGINLGKDDLNDFIDDLYSASEIRTDLKGARVAEEGPILSEEAKKEYLTREVRAKMEAPKEAPATINPAKFDFTNEILRKNNVSEKVISDISKTLSMEEKALPTFEAVKILEEVFGLVYEPKDLANTLDVLENSDKDEYTRLTAMIETSDRLFNLDIEEYEGRVDINTGDAIYDLEKEILDVLGPVDPTEVFPPDFNEDAWVQEAWAEPPKKKGKAKKTSVFEDVVSQQTGVDPNNKDDYNSTGAAYTDPLEQEQRSQDDKAQAEYTGEKEVSRPQARERTTLRSLWGFMYSQSAQTVRRHSGASPTAGVIADTILRAPHEKLREKETKSGRDYVQKKSMAQGQFRMEFQEALDQLTNSGGVISLKVNQQLKDYFNNGTLPANGRVAAAARKLKDAAEKLYAWSEKVGTKYTEDFSLRPLDGGTFPRVYDTEKVASPEGRQKLFDLLASIGIKDNAEAGTYEATDAYNIILESGGFVSGDFTTPARQSQATMKQQEELFNFIERSISRDQLGDLLLTDFQGIVPRFVDKATEMTVYAELFGHRGEHLSELKDKVKQEIVDYNRNSKDVRVDPERVLGDITDLVDILHHRYKADLIPTGGRKFLQAAMNATTMASLTLVSLASMPEFLTATALGSKNPAKFATNLLGGATFAALRGLNGMNKFLTGTVGKGYFDPKTNIGKRAKMLRQLGLFDIASLGEAAAQRYVGPNFIKSGVGTSTNSLPLKTLYRMYGLGNLEKGRFRARQLRAAANMDVYFELTLLTTLTQMQQMMALNNFRQTLVADAKSLSKAGKGKGFKLDSTISQIKSNLKTYGLSNREIKELVRWYEAGHRELHDIPGEFKLDLAGPAQRFVQTAITLPSEGSLPKVFRNPAFAPFLLFKSFITTFGNTFINTAAQRIRFAEGEGAAKKYQQGKQIAGMTATAAAMYGAVQFALALGYLIKYGEDENPWEEKTPDWAKFLQDFERTGLFGPLGSVVVQTATPNYWSWKGKDPFDDILDHMIGPIGKQLSNIGQTAADVAQGKDADLEGRLARSIPLTKSEPIRSALGIEPYYTEDDKGKMVRRRTLEKRAEKKAEKEKAKKQTILDSITDRAVKELSLSKEEIIGLSRSELDEYMRKEFGFDPDGRKSKASMINEFLESKGASEEEFMASPESEAYKKRQAELQSTRDEASKFVKGMSKADKKKEWEKMKGMTNKQFDEYVELEYGLLLDGRKNRAAMEAQFLELIKDLE